MIVFNSTYAKLILIAHVADEEPPQITCASDQTSGAINQPTVKVEWQDLVASDNSGDALEITCDYPSGTAFPIGFTTVICKAVDRSENAAECSFQIEVIGI